VLVWKLTTRYRLISFHEEDDEHVTEIKGKVKQWRQPLIGTKKAVHISGICGMK